MRQLSHDVRIVYIDNDADTIQNCYNHQFQVANPNTYASRSHNLVEGNLFDIVEANYLYVSAQHPIKVIFNHTQEITVEHLSWVNTEVPSDITLINADVTVLENNIQILYGKVESVPTP